MTYELSKEPFDADITAWWIANLGHGYKFSVFIFK